MWKKAKFFLIEIILWLETLHKNDMIYRDLKPENILMDSEWHIKLTEFVLCKILDESNNKTFTLWGIPKRVDFWSLCYFFYEMLTDFLPYYISRNNKINMNIFENKININLI